MKFYKYCSFNPYILSDIKDKKITLSKASTFNDPFDSLPFYNKKELGEVIQPRDTDYYIHSLTKKFNSSIMWGHYADSHYGFCIEYDIPSYQDSDEPYFQDVISSIILRVKYSNDNMRFDATNNLKIMSDFQNELHHNQHTLYINMIKAIINKKEDVFYNKMEEPIKEKGIKNTNAIIDFYKYKDKNWKYENEYRIVVASNPFRCINESSQDRIKITYKQLEISNITGIYFGERSNNLVDKDKISYREDLKRICLERNISTYIMKKHETKYKMVAEPFKLFI